MSTSLSTSTSPLAAAAPETQSKSQSSLVSSPSNSTTQHAHPSPPSHPDPPSEAQEQQDIPLPTLITHLLASKRSLSSITLLYRANAITTQARTSLEHSLILSSQTSFLRYGLVSQVHILQKVQAGLENGYREARREFEDVLKELDEADERLEGTIGELGAMVVEKVFGGRGSGDEEGEEEGEEEKERNLRDFVDEGAVEGLRERLKGEIGRAQEHQATFLSSLQAFDADIQAIKSALSLSHQSHSSSPSTSTHVKPQHHRHHSSKQLKLSVQGGEEDQPTPSPIPHLLTTLESHAAEMALLLDSLVHHFDICVTAIKHTSGGYAAVKQAAADVSSNTPLPDGLSVSGVINEHANDPENLEPISEEERLEMLAVLASDAAEVEDVVRELHHRLASMEGQWEQIRDHVAHLTETYNATMAAFTLLESIAAHLPTYISSAQTFHNQWAESKLLIASHLDELESLRDFYEGYLSCYDGLILEVARRRAEEEKMKQVLRKAMETVRKMWVVDQREREAFRREVGDFLPSDLWGGLVRDAPRWEVSVVHEDGNEEGDGEVGMSTPELGREVVEGAVRRERERRGREEGGGGRRR